MAKKQQPPHELKQLAADLQGRKPEVAVDVLADLSEVQRAFIDDPSKTKAALCSRRAGKTYAILRDLVATCLGIDGAYCLYINRTKAQARNVFWTPTLRFLRKKGIPFTPNEVYQTITFANGSILFCGGADSQDDADRWRGNPFHKVVVDEAQSFSDRYMAYLIEEVLGPTLRDYEGTIILCGTPHGRCHGFFYDLSPQQWGGGDRVPGWSVHHWTQLENPFFNRDGRDVLAEREALKAKHGWTDTTPKYMREELGIWAKDSTLFLYDFDAGRNTFKELPAGDYTYVLGMDLGYRDPTVFAVLAYNRTEPILYVLEVHAETSLIPSVIAERTKGYMRRYRITNIVADCGAQGLAIAEELRQRHGIPVKAAEKREKLAEIELLNGDLVMGFLKVLEPKCQLLIQQWQTLTFRGDGKEDPDQPNDAADAVLYGFRWSFHYRSRPRTKPKVLTVAEQVALQEERMDQAMARGQREEAAALNLLLDPHSQGPLF